MSALSGLSSSSLNSLSGATPSSSSSSAPPVSISGLASGLNTTSIINSLLASQQAQITNLQNEQSTIANQQTLFQQLQAQLASVQSSLSPLASTASNVFSTRTVTSSDQNLVTATATSSAVPGIYSILVNKLAQAQEIASQGFDSTSSTIPTGTVQIQVGAGPTTTVTIDSTNNTLQGLADAINNAGAGVTASIINDGSGNGAQPFRLLLTANQSGASNTINLTNQLNGGGAVQPDFNSTYIGPVDLGAGYNGTATPTANTGAGGYTGSSNDNYTFTVQSGGVVGASSTDTIQIGYTDSTGAHTGTLTFSGSDVNGPQSVAQGLQVQFGAGTLVAGQTFAVKTYVPGVQQAANASVTLGSGSGALTVQSSTNQVQGLINGITLNLQSANPSTPVSLTVANNTSAAVTDVQNFVQAYNSLGDFINQQDSYNPTTQTAGPLLGNQEVLNIQRQLQGVLGNSVPGVNSQLNNLGALGITFNGQGQLVLNQTQLQNVLSGQVSGVSLNDVSNLFTLSGASTNPGVQFLFGTAQTQASVTPYQVNITQAAQQASITATQNQLAASTVIDSGNDTIKITVDGQQSSTITLAQGTYTPQQLAQQVQTEINANSALAGRQVAASVNNGYLEITSNSYGSASQVQIGAGTALTPLGFAGTESNKGKDVAGNFEVDGVNETAVGSGQVLTGANGNANSAGLQVLVTLTPAQVGSGASAGLTITRGIAAQLNDTLTKLLNPVNGDLQSLNTSDQSQVQDIQKQINTLNQTMAAQRQSLVNQFTAMEQAISQLQSVGNFLTQQFNSLSGSTSGTTKLL